MTQGRLTIAEALLARLPLSPDIYVQAFDHLRETARLIEFGAEAYRSASFLDDRALTPSTKGAVVPLAKVIDASRAIVNAKPVHFIFHTGHVGSTLVSRLLDDSGAVLSLREPVPLRRLAAVHDDLDELYSLLSREQFDELLDTFLRLWSRGYTTTQCAVVKATSIAGRLAPAILQRSAGSRAIYLNLRAEPYLATLLAGQNSRDDLRGHGPERLRRLISFGLEMRLALHQLSLGQLAAMSWLAESLSQRDALQRFGERVAAIDFDAFLTNVSDGVARIAKQFELPTDSKFLAGIANSPTLTRYAKATEHAYTPQFRAEILADSRGRNRAEIREGVRWLEEAARANTAVAEILNAGA